MKRIAIFIPEPQYRRFQALAQTEDRPYAELMRDALARYLEARGASASGKKTERKRAVTRKRP